MRAEGKDWRQIAEFFGLENERDVLTRTALGNVPNIQICLNVSLREAIQYLLPLRIETGRNPDNGNERIYDYSEATGTIDKLVSGELTKKDLPSYSADRRLAIQQAQQDTRLKQIAAQKLATWKEKFSGNRKKPGPQEGVKFCGRARAFVVAEGRIPYAD